MKEEWRWEEKEVAVWSDDAVDNFISWILFTPATALVVGLTANYYGLVAGLLGIASFGCFCSAVYFGLKMFETKTIRIQVKG